MILMLIIEAMAFTCMALSELHMLLVILLDAYHRDSRQEIFFSKRAFCNQELFSRF